MIVRLFALFWSAFLPAWMGGLVADVVAGEMHATLALLQLFVVYMFSPMRHQVYFLL